MTKDVILTVQNTDTVGMAVHESVSPYGEMMAALKAYVDSLIAQMGVSGITFCEQLPETGYNDHLWIVTTTAAAYIWVNDWVMLAGGDVPLYTGQTTVTPKVAEGTTLETKDTRLDEDIEVTKIPVSDIENDKGGKTVTIG